jgi:DNA (cytosine-5)-methyltransferase 1
MRAVELFCGAGGLSAGLQRAGIEVVRAYDAWDAAVENYRANVGPHVEQADLKDLLKIVPEIMQLAPDMICGGPPCQDYSTAGKRVEGRNAKLTLAFAMTIVCVRPQWFLMENVVQAQNSRAWGEARQLLMKAGYGLTQSKIDCSFYGVPQARRRLFVIGRLGEREGFLQSAVLRAASKEPLSLRKAFECNPFHEDREICRHSDNAALTAIGHVYTRPLHGGRAVRPIDGPFATVTRTSAEKPTPRYFNSSHPLDSAPVAHTARISQRQLSRIQGFSRRWRWHGTKRNIMQMIANGVPAPVAKVIGEIILRRHKGESVPEVPDTFLDWMVREHGRSRGSARNVKSQLGRARKLLSGRTFSELSLEIAALERITGFQNIQSSSQKSDLRNALRFYSEFQDTKRGQRAIEGAAKTRILRKRLFQKRVELEILDLEEMMSNPSIVSGSMYVESWIPPGQVSVIKPNA